MTDDTLPLDTQRRDELNRLLSALEDGTLEPADEARLAELLQTDPAARARYYDHVLLAALLRREGRRAAAQSPADRDRSRHAPRDEPLAQSVRTTSGRPRLWLIALAASILLALSLSIGEATGVTQLVPTIIRVVTGEGSLVIEVDDPSVSVTLDGQDITITGAGIHELRLSPGKHAVAATKNGQPVPVDQAVVTISRGGRQTVRVTQEGVVRPAPQVTAGETRRFEGPDSMVQAVALTPDGGQALSVSWENAIRLWDTKTGEELHTFDLREEGIAYAMQCVAVSPDGRRALAGGIGKPLSLANADLARVWLLDLENRRILNRCDHTLRSPDYYGVTGVAFSPDGRQALLGSFDGVVRIWDVDKWQELGRIEHANFLWSVAYSPDGSRGLFASGGHGVRLYLDDLKTRQTLHSFEGHGMWRAVFSPDGRHIVCASGDKTLRVWDAGSGNELRCLTHPDEVHGVAFCPDGRRIVTACHDAIVRLWDWESGKELHRFVGHTGQVTDVAVSRDGRWILSGSADGTIRLWELLALNK